jgi:hypothetical protein
LQIIYDYINENTILLIFALTVTCCILIVTTIILLVKAFLTRKRLNLFFGTDKNKHSIEAMLIDYVDNVTSLNEKYDSLQKCSDKLTKDFALCIQKIGIIRYNPFDNHGGDLSFALALLDNNNNGIVMNTLHNREQSYSYAKSVKGLESSYPLTKEEKDAIRMAMEIHENK